MHALLASVPAVDLTAGGVLGALDPRSLLSGLGAFGVFLILFAETGLLIGFFLPGDSLLFTAGLLCTTSSHSAVHLSLPTVLPDSFANVTPEHCSPPNIVHPE